MAIQHGENVAKKVTQGRVVVKSTGWTLLAANGSSNLQGRTHVRIQTKGKPGNSLCLAYALGATTDGTNFTFTTPTDGVKTCTQFRGTATWVEPVGDRVQIYGRLLNKAAATESSLVTVITEYA